MCELIIKNVVKQLHILQYYELNNHYQ